MVARKVRTGAEEEEEVAEITTGVEMTTTDNSVGTDRDHDHAHGLEIDTIDGIGIETRSGGATTTTTGRLVERGAPTEIAMEAAIETRDRREEVSGSRACHVHRYLTRRNS